MPRHSGRAARAAGDALPSNPAVTGTPTERSSSIRRFPFRLTPARLDWVTGGIVLVVYAIAQLALFQGPHPFDPARYFRTAIDFPDVRGNLWTLRIGLIVPVRVAVAVLGPSEAALYAVPLGVGLVLAGAVYWTMLLLFHDRMAAAAASLVAVLNANFLLNSSFIFPDTAATATFTAGFFCLVLGGMPSTAQRLGGWGQSAACASAGVLFGWTYLIREFSPLLLPAVLAAILLLRYPLRRVALLAGVAVGTVALELLYGQVNYGRPLLHLEKLLSREERMVSDERALRLEHLQGQVDDPLDAIIVFPRLLLSWQVGFLTLLLVAIFLVAIALFPRDKRLWILAIWCFGFWAAMAALAVVPFPSGRWILNVTNIRYWYPLLPALVMGAFGGLTLLIREFFPTRGLTVVARLAAPIVAALVLIPGVVEFDRCAAKSVWKNDPGTRWEELRSWFSTPGAEDYRVVWTDQDTARLLPAFIRTTFGDRLWPGATRTFKDPTRLNVSTDLERSLILLHYARLTATSLLEPKLQELRSDWAPLFISDDGMMAVLAYQPAPAGVTDSDQPWWEAPTPRAEEATGCGLSPYEPSGESP